jgi:hypothetical protein
MRKVFLSTLFAFVVGMGAAQAADMVVKIAPPSQTSVPRSVAVIRSPVVF